MINTQTSTNSLFATAQNPVRPSAPASSQTLDAATFSKMVMAGMNAAPIACVHNGDEARTAGTMPVACSASSTQAANNAGSAENGKSHGGFIGFILGVLDVINPLQHIPVISTLYRHLTGDEISPMAQVVGDTLYGGPIGAAFSVANLAVKADTGEDMGEHVLAMVTGEKGQSVPAGTPAQAVMVARTEDKQAAPAPVTQDKGNVPELSDAQWARLLSKNAPASKPPVVQTVDAPVSTPPQNAFQKKYFNFRLAPEVVTPAPKQQHPRPIVQAPALLAAQEKNAGGISMPSEAVPQGQIAQRMMDGLDKYAAMEKTDMAQR